MMLVELVSVLSGVNTHSVWVRLLKHSMAPLSPQGSDSVLRARMRIPTHTIQTLEIVVTSAHEAPRGPCALVCGGRSRVQAPGPQ